MQFDNAMCFYVGGKEYVQPSKIAMQPLKRRWEFTHISERAAELRYWSCDIRFECFLCLLTHDLPLKFVRSVHNGDVKGEMSKSHLPDADLSLCWAMWWMGLQLRTPAVIAQHHSSINFLHLF